MLEDQVAKLLQRYLGNYVLGLNKEALKISVWAGNVELTNMQLKPEALNALKLPIRVKAGFLGSVKLKVPWNKLGQDPVIVYLDRIYLLAEPATQVEGCSEAAVQEAKKSRIREMERKLLERAEDLKSEMNKTWLGSLVNTVIGNLKLSISNIHIRYEDLESNPGHPFAAGLSLEKLSAVTTDDSGRETFVTGGTLDCIQKLVKLERLAFYLDSDISPWLIDKPWGDFLPSEWDQVFRFGTKDGKPADCLIKKHSYILEPVSGNANYSKMRTGASSDNSQPLQKASVNLDDVILCLSKDGYRDALKLADNFAAFNQRLKYAHYRPTLPVSSDPRSWWKFAYKAVSSDQKRESGKLSWEHVLKYATLRKRYISLYASLLRSDASRAIVDDNEEIEELDRELDIEVILQWRMWARKFVSRSMESENHLKEQKTKTSWWSFGWKSQSVEGDSESVHFTEEDLEQLNQMIGYKEDDDAQFTVINDKPNVLHTFLEIRMRHSASKLYGLDKKCLADLSCEGLDVSIKLYPETKIIDLKLRSYRLSSPNGLLAESAAAFDSLVAMFCYKPFEAKVDWSMVAKASPCYMTYLKDSVDAIVNFFGNDSVVSQAIAQETAAAVQMTIDEVKRTAQQQMNRALKDHTRFLLDLDIAAPKITIPTDFCPDNTNPTKLLLDLGNLVIRSQDDYEGSSKESDMYLKFDLVLSNVSASLVDGDYSWSQAFLGSAHKSSVFVLPVVDKCGIVLNLQQIRIPNTSYPSTRLSMRLPSLGFHFSPARYHRLMQVMKIFQKESDEGSTLLRPWDEADLEGWLFLLVWKAREAVWQRLYFCLIGPFLYVLESPSSKSYKQYLSLRGKQIYEVPADSAAGVPHVLAISYASSSNKKVMEDVNALVLRCDSDESKKIWKRRLQGAIYRFSGSAPISGLSDTSSSTDESDAELNDNQDLFDLSKNESVFVTGMLDELKICFTYTSQHDLDYMAVLLAEERRLFNFRAVGGKVEISLRENDILIGTMLKSLEVEDLVCCNQLSQPCYLARSFLGNADAASSFDDTGNQHLGDEFSISEGDDKFYEAAEDLVDNIDYAMQSPLNVSRNRSSQSLLQPKNLSLMTPSFARTNGLLPGDSFGTMREDVVATESVDSFVKAQVVLYDQSSFQYENIDKRVIVTLATLSFFCRRPTILAIMEFVNAINVEEGSCELFDDSSPAANGEHTVGGEDALNNQTIAMTEESAAKGLLGTGKSRIVFNLTLNMARAQIVLMYENETKLATLSQDNLLLDIKVFPSSFSIKAALGNLRISDNSLPSSHMYFWSCDMRDPGGTSFVELQFTSFSTEDEDYEGYDYFLLGQLSEVRIVYLNRFIQEVVSYFMGLVPNSSDKIVKLKDQVTNSEKWFTTTELEGSPAVKLDISLRKPIIVMPRNTDSLDYLKLDIVHITLKNTFQWYGDAKHELGAVHLDILTIMVEDINLNVSTESELGESIVRDVKGVSVVIHRSLRDLLHQIPSMEVLIKIEELRAALTNKEYQIVTECAQSNISETPHSAPPLKNVVETSSYDKVEPVTPQDPVAVELRNGESWITMKVSLIIDLVELCLYTGSARDVSLATVQISGAWLLYKANTLDEGFLSATLKGFTVIDDREGTENQFRLAVGTPSSTVYADLSSSSATGSLSMVGGNLTEGDSIKPIPSMLILDAKFGRTLTFVSVCVQRPQLLVALDFLFAVVEFFVPTVGSLLSGEEENKCLDMADAIIIDQAIYKQPVNEISLSPQKPIIVEDERSDYFIYDGNDGTLFLKDRNDCSLSSPSTEALIYVGNGKKLQFKNVTIKSGQYLDSCISLGSNSSYSASSNDGVYLDIGTEEVHLERAEENVNVLSSSTTAANRSMEFILELQAIGPELTFYSASKDIGASPLLANKLLHAQLDAFGRVVLKGDTVEMTANVLGLTMESNGIRILEPFDTSTKFSNASGKTNINLSVSHVFMNFTFSTLRLFLAVEEDIMSFLRMTSKKKTMTCSKFDRIGTVTNPKNDQVLAFWRPQAPPGFAVLGDYLTPLDKPPTKGVLAVNTNIVRVKRPVSFKLIWPILHPKGSFGEITDIGPSENGVGERESSCSVWFPEAPKGYVSLGCVVSTGRMQPSRSSSFCILESLVSPCSLRDCVAISSTNICPSSLAFWRVDSSVGTFLPADPISFSSLGRAYDLRRILFEHREVPSATKFSDGEASSSGHIRSQQILSSARRFEAVATFQLIWWNRGSNSSKKVSIWRPVVPQGMVYFGDVAVVGYEPPNTCIVLHDGGDEELFKPALDFQFIGQVKKQRGLENISFWMPQAPPGFVSLGCIACKSTPKQYDFNTFRCVRSDMVIGDQFLEESIWDTSDAKLKTEPFSLWTIGNELNTFITRIGLKKPPRRYAVKLAGQGLPSGSDDTVVDAEIGTFSAALLDDYSGLMVPLFNISLSNIAFSLHGRTEYLNSTVSFSLAARSYNDKYESWEPLIEPVDGFLRYQYDLNSPSAASQLRLTSTRDLNVNVSVSNANTIIQAYASWNNLTHVHEYQKARDVFSSSYSGRSIVDVHHKRNYYIIPQNKLGRDIFIRAIELGGYQDVIRMPSGDMKAVKVPVSKNMLDSHVRGELCGNVKTMVTVVIIEAQFAGVGGLTAHQYTVSMRVIPNTSLPSESRFHQQSARTSASISNQSTSELEVVNWSEVFFFKVDSPDLYNLELLLTDMGGGDVVGFYSAPLGQLAGYVHDSMNQHEYANNLVWIDLSRNESMTSEGDKSKECAKIRCAVLLSPRQELENKKEVSIRKESGFIQISPSMEGPWTTVRLNYATPAACWRLGNDVIASEVIVKDGNRYVNIRSLVSVSNSSDFILDLCLVPNVGGAGPEIPVGLIKPGDAVSLPLSGLAQSGLYVLRLKPVSCDSLEEYSWSSVVAKPGEPDCSGEQSSSSEICLSTLTESEQLLCCSPIGGTSSGGSHKLWFCVSIQATEIAKDIRSDPIEDWTLVVKSPLCITNYLPLAAEYSVLEKHDSGHFVGCSRGVFGPGKTVKVYDANIRNPLYFSLLPQSKWLPINEAVLISHPQGAPTKAIGFRSSVSGRIVQVILEQNYNKEKPLLSKTIRIYVPYWFSIARCPPLTFRFIDLATKKQTRKLNILYNPKKGDNVSLEEINQEEIYEGHTIASALNFKLLSLSVAVARSEHEQWGPVKDLSALGDMDGSLDLYAYENDGKCMRLFISTQPCPYPSVPTKVVSVRPFMTFTNRLGEDMHIKLNSEDEPNVLRASDSRVSFLYCKSGGRDELQVRLGDTNWSFPIHIAKEDTITLVLRGDNGIRRFVKTEIRGFEEGSRFIVVFRLGSTSGPIRIENRTDTKVISIRQSGFGEDAWTQIRPLSTTNFSWEDPYGQKVIDAKINSSDVIGDWKLDMDKVGFFAEVEESLGMQFHVSEMGDIKVARFISNRSLESSHEEIRCLAPIGKWGDTHIQGEMQNITTLELIVELGVVGISVVDHRPKELSYMSLERVFVSYSTGYDGGTTSRFKLILGHLQVDNQLPLTLMPVLLTPERVTDIHHPVFKMTITMRNEDADGIQVYPYVYIRVTEIGWRLNIHEPIIWTLVDFYNNLQLDRIPKSSSVTVVDPEIRIDLIDVSEVRLKVSLETAPAQRPHGVLGVWSPVLSAVGNAFKIQVHLRRVMHNNRFIRKSSIVPAIGNRIWRDLIHNPLHLIFSVDVIGMTSSTLASLSKGFAELSTDGQFLQLRAKQVWSRKITGVGDAIVQGTEALAQGVAFGVSGVVTKPVRSARQNGLLGFAHGLGQAFLGFFVQPVSGALDFFSLTVDGIGASCTRCLEVLSNRTTMERVRNPRAIRADCILREYSEKEAVGQMILQIAEASRHFGCTEIFKEPSKFAWSDYYEDHFIIAALKRIVLVTNKRVILLQSSDLDKMDRKPSKIMWDVPWEEVMALELAKAGGHHPSHLILHLKSFKRSENFVRVIKCSVEEEVDQRDPQAIRICSVVRKIWRAYQSYTQSLTLKVPLSQRYVYFTWNGTEGRESHTSSNGMLKSREISSGSSSQEKKFVKHTMNFIKIWSSEREIKGRCTLCRKQDSEEGGICSIWRPICSEGYVSIGDIAHVGTHAPNVAAVYSGTNELFARPIGYDLVWRNCLDDYKFPVSIWHPRAPEGFVSAGCVAVAGFAEPEPNTVSCMSESLAEETVFEEQKVWSASDSYPWGCHIYQVQSDALHLIALRQTKEESEWKPIRVRDDYQTSLPESSMT